MPTGDIVTNLIGNNRLTPAVTAATGALKQYGQALDSVTKRRERWQAGLRGADEGLRRQLGETRARGAFLSMLEESNREASRSIQITGRQQMAIQQLVFAVDDAATSYGTAGLAGAVRGAANNLTMAASLMGPWAAAVAVGVSAVVQLGLAFTKSKNEIKENADAMKSFRGEVELAQKAIDRIQAPRLPGQITGDNRLGLLESTQTALDVTSRRRMSAQEDMAALQQRQREFALQNTSDRTDVIAGLSPEARKTWEAMNEEIEEFRKRISDLSSEEGVLTTMLGRLRDPKVIEDIQQEEARRFQEQQEQFQIEEERRRIATAQEQFNTGAAAIRDGFGTPRSRGNAGPATLTAGSADAFRFVNAARAGAANKSAEAIELAKSNAKLDAMLQELRKQTAQANNVPEEVIDF